MAAENVNSLHHYQLNSRLHFIGTWRTKADALMRSIYNEEPGLAALHRLPLEPSAASMPPSFVHIDMDAYFCSVALCKPENAHLRHSPVAIASGSRHSEISSCNYIARQFGVRAGDWVGAARQRCPDLAVLRYDFAKCEEFNRRMYLAILRAAPVGVRTVMEVYSVDEVMCALYTDDAETVTSFCTRVRSAIETCTQGCTATCGAGPSILVARLTTGTVKPNGQRVVMGASRQETACMADEFVANASVSSLHGAGRQTMERLAAAFALRCPEVAASLGMTEPAQASETRKRQREEALPLGANLSGSNHQQHEQLGTGKRKRGRPEDDDRLESLEQESVLVEYPDANQELPDPFESMNTRLAETSGDAAVDEGDGGAPQAATSLRSTPLYPQFLCKHLRLMSLADLQSALGKKSGLNFFGYCRGDDNRTVFPTGAPRTFVDRRTMGAVTSGPLDAARIASTSTDAIPSAAGIGAGLGSTDPLGSVHAPLPASVGCTMNYAVRPQTLLCLCSLFDTLVSDVFSTLERLSASCSMLRMTVLERHPDSDEKTTKFLGCGWCNTFNFSVKQTHGGGQQHLRPHDGATASSLLHEALGHLVEAHDEGNRPSTEPREVNNNSSKGGACDAAVVAPHGRLGTGLVTTSGERKIMPLRDVRGVGLHAIGLRPLSWTSVAPGVAGAATAKTGKVQTKLTDLRVLGDRHATVGATAVCDNDNDDDDGVVVIGARAAVPTTEDGGDVDAHSPSRSVQVDGDGRCITLSSSTGTTATGAAAATPTATPQNGVVVIRRGMGQSTTSLLGGTDASVDGGAMRVAALLRATCRSESGDSKSRQLLVRPSISSHVPLGDEPWHEICGIACRCTMGEDISELRAVLRVVLYGAGGLGQRGSTEGGDRSATALLAQRFSELVLELDLKERFPAFSLK